MILYYAGHGWAPGNDFILSGMVNASWAASKKKNHLANILSTQSSSKFDLSVDWFTVQRILDSAEGKTLAIFDCCGAGRLCGSLR